MRALVSALENMPKLLKCLLCIPAIAIVWAIYRVARSVVKGNIIGIVLSIVLIFIGIPWLWLVDLICILLYGNVWWID